MQEESPKKWERTIIEECLVAGLREKRIARRWGIFFKLLFVAYLYLMYFTFFKGTGMSLEEEKEHTALIELRGEISEKEASNAASLMISLGEAFKEKRVKAIIVHINSPGGSPVQAAYVYDEIKRLRQAYPEKKLYAVISDVGASAAYYIAAAADAIYADPSSIVGSIGVVMQGFGMVDLLHKLGVEDRTIIAGEHKNFYSPFAAVKPEEKAYAEVLLHSVHQQFIDKVKQGRGSRLKEDPLLFSGLFWSGAQALPLGLIDGFGSVGFVAREVIEQETIVDYSMRADLLDRISSKIGAFLKQSIGLKRQIPLLH